MSKATIKITETRTTTNVGESVRSVPRPGGWTFLPASEPATASTASSGRKRALIITRPPRMSLNEIPNCPWSPWTKPV